MNPQSRLALAAEELLNGISKAIRGLDPSQVEGMLEAMINVRAEGKRILVVGAGRSGLVGKAFAMRLMHLGFNVYVMGETITPSVGRGDVVLIISGSGSTTLPVTVASMAKRMGAKAVVVTSFPDSPLGKMADSTVIVPGRRRAGLEEEYNSRQLMGEHEPMAPMGTIFEDTCIIFLDSVIAELMARLRVSEEEMMRKHATIE